MAEFFGQMGLSNDILPHIFGLCALICSVTAWQLKNPRHIILLYVPSGIFWGLQYYFFGAYAALAICCLSVVKDGLVGLLPSKYSRYIIFIHLALAYTILLNLYSVWIDILPLIATTIINVGLLFPDNRRFVTRMNISHQFIWLYYNISFDAWMSVVCSTFVVCSTLIGMARHEKWEIGKCRRTFFPSVMKSLFPNFRTYP
ncbi:MAG: YgjV family protein [Pseudomonadota bacterium]